MTTEADESVEVAGSVEASPLWLVIKSKLQTTPLSSINSEAGDEGSPDSRPRLLRAIFYKRRIRDPLSIPTLREKTTKGSSSQLSGHFDETKDRQTRVCNTLVVGDPQLEVAGDDMATRVMVHTTSLYSLLKCCLCSGREVVLSHVSRP